MNNTIKMILTNALKEHYSNKTCDEIALHLHIMKKLPLSEERTLIEDLLEYMRMNPSKVEDKFWVYAFAPELYDISNEYFGKWMIFVPLNRLDETWGRIVKAVESGRLGPVAKAATARENSLATEKETKVIIVYTKDYRDREDVFRVRRELKRLGFGQILYYKTDEATKSGKYGKGSWLYSD